MKSQQIEQTMATLIAPSGTAAESPVLGDQGIEVADNQRQSCEIKRLYKDLADLTSIQAHFQSRYGNNYSAHVEGVQ
jgi:hypothetical protein